MDVKGSVRERIGPGSGVFIPEMPGPVSSNRRIAPESERPSVSGQGKSEAGARLDVWLDIACLFRTRSEAQKAVQNGKVDVNGQTAKSHRMLKPGDQLTIGRPFGRKQTLIVKGIAERHVSKADARTLYEDTTPPLTPEEIEMRKMDRIIRASITPPTAPDRRARRALRKMKEGDGF